MLYWFQAGKILGLSSLLFFTGTLNLGFGLNLIEPAYADSFNPPDRGLPGRRRGGGTRNIQSSCLISPSVPLTALLPANNLGLTTAMYPQIFWFVPAHNAPYIEVSLYATNTDFQDQNLLFLSQFQTNGTAGIGHFKIPDGINFTPLKEGDTYHWYISLVCDPDDRSRDITVSGWLERIPLDPDLAIQLNNLTGIDRSQAFAQNGVWYDALEILAELQCSPHSDVEEMKNQWKVLLEDDNVNLGDLADFPWLRNCNATP